MLRHILRNYKQFETKFNMNISIFYHSNYLTNPFFKLLKSTIKGGCIFIFVKLQKCLQNQIANL
jgi:hypothetical protein